MHPIYPHGGIEELAPGLWQVKGTLGRSPLPRTMAVYRLSGGGLWIHSGVALDEPGMAALEKLGPPQLLVVPNRFHRSDAPWYKARYPELQVVCPAAARERVEQVLAVDGDAERVLPGLGVACHVPEGIKPSELAYELPLKAGRALVFTDLLFNLDPLAGVSGRIMALLGSTGFFGLTRIGRWMLLKDAAAFRAWLLRLAALPGLEVISVAHGDPITRACRRRLTEAAERLRA